MSFWNSLPVVFSLMQSEQRWREDFHGRLLRLLTPAKRLSIHLGRIWPRCLPDPFV